MRCTNYIKMVFFFFFFFRNTKMVKLKTSLWRWSQAVFTVHLKNKRLQQKPLPPLTTCKMSGGLLKQLAYTLSSRCFTTFSRPSTHPSPSRFFRNRKLRELSQPNSLAAKFSTSSPETPTPSAEPFASPFLSVQIRCQKHFAVSFFFSFLFLLHLVQLLQLGSSSCQLICLVTGI